MSVVLKSPLKCFSNQADKATFAFNPMTQPFWTNFDLLTRTDILCAACGLSYGADYGASYFSSANAAILHHALKTFPEVTSFSELADAIGEVLVSAKKRDLHPEIRKAGVHVHEVMKRLAACGPLNVTSTSDHAPAVAREAINLVPLFEEPQLMYFHLPATLSPSAAPEIARPVIIESEYHISPDEYQRRRKLPWPAAEGMFVPREQTKRSSQVQPSRPKKSQVTMEVIGDSPSAPLNDAELKSIEDLFQGFKQDFSDDDADKRGLRS